MIGEQRRSIWVCLRLTARRLMHWLSKASGSAITASASLMCDLATRVGA